MLNHGPQSSISRVLKEDTTKKKKKDTTTQTWKCLMATTCSATYHSAISFFFSFFDLLDSPATGTYSLGAALGSDLLPSSSGFWVKAWIKNTCYGCGFTLWIPCLGNGMPGRSGEASVTPLQENKIENPKAQWAECKRLWISSAA